MPVSPGWRSAWLPPLLLLGAAGFVLRNAAHATVADLDMFHELALIREAIALGRLPLEDTFSFVETVRPVIHHEWATGAVLYLFAVLTGWGLAGIALLHWLLITAIAGAAYAVARRAGGDAVTMALLAGIASTMLAPGLAPVRAQMFTYLFLLLMLLLAIPPQRRDGQFLFLWATLFIVWLNMHGGFLVGAGLYLVFVVESFARVAAGRSLRDAMGEQRARLGALVLLPLIVLINPYGVHYPRFVLGAVTMERPLIAEWAPLWAATADPVLQMAFLLSVVVLCYAVAHRGATRLAGLLMLVVAAVFAVRHQRLVPVYSLVWFALVPGYLAGTPLHVLLTRFVERRHRLTAAACVIVFAFGLASVVQQRAWQLRVPGLPGEHELHYPVGAVRFLEEAGFAGNLMTPFDAGSYVMWRLHPHVRVGLDSRYEVAYPPAWIRENTDMYRARRGWQEVLTRHGADAVLVPTASPLNAALRSEQSDVQWSEWYRDAAFAVFGREQRPAASPGRRRDRRY